MLNEWIKSYNIENLKVLSLYIEGKYLSLSLNNLKRVISRLFTEIFWKNQMPSRNYQHIDSLSIKYWRLLEIVWFFGSKLILKFSIIQFEFKIFKCSWKINTKWKNLQIKICLKFKISYIYCKFPILVWLN